MIAHDILPEEECGAAAKACLQVGSDSCLNFEIRVGLDIVMMSAWCPY